MKAVLFFTLLLLPIFRANSNPCLKEKYAYEVCNPLMDSYLNLVDREHCDIDFYLKSRGKKGEALLKNSQEKFQLKFNDLIGFLNSHTQEDQAKKCNDVATNEFEAAVYTGAKKLAVAMAPLRNAIILGLMNDFIKNVQEKRKQGNLSLCKSIDECVVRLLSFKGYKESFHVQMAYENMLSLFKKKICDGLYENKNEHCRKIYKETYRAYKKMDHASNYFNNEFFEYYSSSEIRGKICPFSVVEKACSKLSRYPKGRRNSIKKYVNEFLFTRIGPESTGRANIIMDQMCGSSDKCLRAKMVPKSMRRKYCKLEANEKAEVLDVVIIASELKKRNKSFKKLVKKKKNYKQEAKWLAQYLKKQCSQEGLSKKLGSVSGELYLGTNVLESLSLLEAYMQSENDEILSFEEKTNCAVYTATPPEVELLVSTNTSRAFDCPGDSKKCTEIYPRIKTHVSKLPRVHKKFISEVFLRYKDLKKQRRKTRRVLSSNDFSSEVDKIKLAGLWSAYVLQVDKSCGHHSSVKRFTSNKEVIRQSKKEIEHAVKAVREIESLMPQEEFAKYTQNYEKKYKGIYGDVLGSAAMVSKIRFGDIWASCLGKKKTKRRSVPRKQKRPLYIASSKEVPVTPEVQSGDQTFVCSANNSTCREHYPKMRKEYLALESKEDQSLVSSSFQSTKSLFDLRRPVFKATRRRPQTLAEKEKIVKLWSKYVSLISKSCKEHSLILGTLPTGKIEKFSKKHLKSNIKRLNQLQRFIDIEDVKAVKSYEELYINDWSSCFEKRVRPGT